MKRLVTLVLALMMLASCVALAEDTPKWLQPYDETVEITFGRSGTTTNPRFIDGESIDNNYYVKWIKDQFNIEMKSMWLAEGDAYTTRINLAMTTGEFPDVFSIGGSSAKIVIRQMIEAGYLADLTSALEEYSSDLVKDIIASYGGLDIVCDQSTRDADGKIYAFPWTSNGGEYDFVWIRVDWLEKLNLEKPTNFEELIEVARAFIENNMGGEKTVGIEIDPNTRSAYNGTDRLAHLYHNFEAYPAFWYANEDGDYVYGSVQPEAKEALAYLAELYAEGIIDKEFKTKDNKASLAAGNSGIMFGPWWMGAWPLNDCKANDPNSYWEPIWVKHDDGMYHTISPDVANETTYWLASATCEKPEVLIQMLNINAEQQNLYNIEKYDTFSKNIPQDVDTHYNDTDYTFDWGSWPVNMKIRYFNQLERLSAVWNDLVAEVEMGNEIPVFNTESFDGKAIVAYKNGEDNSVNGQHVYTKTLALEMIAEHADEVVEQRVYNPAPTATMEYSWSNLLDLEDQAYAKIIMGEEPIEYFDTFVEQWMAQGGADITAEVNAQAKGE